MPVSVSLRFSLSLSGSFRLTEGPLWAQGEGRTGQRVLSQESPCLISQRGSYGPSDKVVPDALHIGMVEWWMS